MSLPEEVQAIANEMHRVATKYGLIELAFTVAPRDNTQGQSLSVSVKHPLGHFAHKKEFQLPQAIGDVQSTIAEALCSSIETAQAHIRDTQKRIRTSEQSITSYKVKIEDLRSLDPPLLDKIIRAVDKD